MKLIGNNWDNVLEEEYSKKYFNKLLKFIDKEYQEKIIYPVKDNIFRALKLTDFNAVKVVILGQDPYHGEGEANGLAFSVSDNVKLPPSLKNIYKELKNDLGIEISIGGNLESWAKEGILLLNTVLTVEKDKPASHKNVGWELFTDTIIKELNEKDNPVVFVLWGKFAKSKQTLITNPIHHIITSPHPSPFSARTGFFDSKPFSKVNCYLKEDNLKEIDWNIY